MSSNRRAEKAREGQVIIIVVIILIVLFLFFALIPARDARQRATPLVRSAFWKVAEINVTEVDVNQEVELFVVLEATEAYEGSIVVKVKKDVSYWFDSDYVVKTFPVSLAGGQRTEISLLFIPDQASGGTFRGYFAHIEFQAKKTDWTMDNLYPPRLEVKKRSTSPNMPV